MTLGSLWHLFARGTQISLLAGSISVLAGVAIGLAPAIGFQPAGGGGAPLELLLPSLFLSLGGGYAVHFPGIRVGRGKVRILRDWKINPVSGRLLWILAHATAAIGLVACVLAGRLTLERQANEQRFRVKFNAKAFDDAGAHLARDGQHVRGAGGATVGDGQRVFRGQ